MLSETAAARSHRLPPRPGEEIDRSRTIRFRFAGQTVTAHPGDTIGSALAAAGVQVLSRSFKYHRPRGLMCGAGHCPNCLVQVGDEPNVRACTRPVADGMEVTPQNAWPSLDRDVMALTALGDRFLPVGFYYKTFIRPQRLWPLYEHVLRQVAGLGRINPETKPAHPVKQYLHADVVVVGGGPAGLSAAVAAAGGGARVLLVDENAHLGGHTRFGPGEDGVTGLLAVAGAQDGLQILTGATVIGWWEENWLAAVRGERLYKIRAGAVVVATGAYEQPLVFDNNDLPGVMLGGGVQRLLRLYGVAPGSTAVVVTANEDGWQVARELQSAGVRLAAVVDQRPAAADDGPPAALAGGTVLWGHTILAAGGRGHVERAELAPITPHGEVSTGAAQTIGCDLLVISVAWAPANGLLYQGGARMAYDETRHEFRPHTVPDGVFTAGRVNGTHLADAQLEEGALAGRRALAYLGLAAAPEMPDVAAQGAEPVRTSDLVRVPGRQKRFVCYCEDVTDKDLETAIAEGYDSIELLKRYSTISMGPCQGKMCSLNAIHLCARARQQTVMETGATTARPPVTPVPLAALAGQNMEPVRITPVHQWHRDQGARMMVAGLWLRPEHYGDPLAEVRAVRERVGLIDVSTLGKLQLTGPGVPALLERLYVNRWRKLAVGRARYGLMCNDEGVIMDDGVTARLADDVWYTTTTSSGAGAVYEWMQWWAQSGWGAGVHITGVTEVFAAFNLAGPRARVVLQRLTDADLSPAAFPYLHVRQVAVAGAPCRLLRIGFTGELSYEIHCPAGAGTAVWQAIIAAGKPEGILPFGIEAQRILRLEKAHIIVGQDTDALTDPLAADMGWAVKLDKPDFLGRRALVRVAAAGPKQRLVGFLPDDPQLVPEEGLQIVRPSAAAPAGQEIIGWVTSSRYSPTLARSIGLCWLPATLAAGPGTPFTIWRDGAPVGATVHHGPFYDPEGQQLRQ